jgi:hypothetical protein
VKPQHDYDASLPRRSLLRKLLSAVTAFRKFQFWLTKLEALKKGGKYRERLGIL